MCLGIFNWMPVMMGAEENVNFMPLWVQTEQVQRMTATVTEQ
jgi:hypothetical protein